MSLKREDGQIIKKDDLLSLLKKNHDSGWEDGDKEKKRANIKTADLINHNLKIALELKEDKTTIIKRPSKRVENSADLIKVQRRFKSDLKSANCKFENYPGYQTLVIITTDLKEDLLEHLIQGLYVLQGTHSFRRSTFDDSLSEVGCMLFLLKDNQYRRKWKKMVNQKAAKERYVSGGIIDEVIRLIKLNYKI